MIVLDKYSKKAEELWNRYCDSRCDDIFEAYGRPSHTKQMVWQQAREEMENMPDGRGLRILGAGSSYFSYAYRFEQDGKHMLRCVFPTKSYEFEINLDLNV